MSVGRCGQEVVVFVHDSIAVLSTDQRYPVRIGFRVPLVMVDILSSDSTRHQRSPLEVEFTCSLDLRPSGDFGKSSNTLLHLLYVKRTTPHTSHVCGLPSAAAAVEVP